MFKNIYDSDIATWSPQGRLYQIEYATEAINQGSTCVAARSKTHTVVCALKRIPQSDFCSYQKKVFRVSENIGICVSGLTSDSRKALKFVRLEAMNHEFAHGKSISVADLVSLVSQKMHAYTLSSSQRPLGMGCIVVGYDNQGSQLLECWPSGASIPCQISAMGVRHQLSKSYIETCTSIGSMSIQELISMALKALLASARDIVYSSSNVSISIVGQNCPFHDLPEDEVTQLISEIRAPS